MPGPKYTRVVSVERMDDGTISSRSAYCFLDGEGNIYKAAGWKAPAPHVRGSIFDENCSWGKGVNIYGAVYIRP